ncbi:hypothetical protein AT15_08605 [Kosmotoga arenicorallina S304]|uniref:HEPN AbiU2-like domain-containing protein n=1 Tax=Kosmotoga arenicorallina S304 TaxID=1453497 RepID=A0A176K267_9BACT|nr:hypothetical protein [Kosmotoga arenicorallina]OAA31025.1 hypothetical protein AT15_08605 [Kosmotoga arenicorallina S304]
MKLESILKPEAVDAFYRRKTVFTEEIKILNNIVDALEELDDLPVKTALFEIACVRSVKLLLNSGYTFRNLRLFLYGNVLKPFRKKLSSALEKLENKEKELEATIRKVKNFRDHQIVHLDPRFAFEGEKNEGISLKDIKEILEYLQESVRVIFEAEY